MDKVMEAYEVIRENCVAIGDDSCLECAIYNKFKDCPLRQKAPHEWPTAIEE